MFKIRAKFVLAMGLLLSAAFHFAPTAEAAKYSIHFTLMPPSAAMDLSDLDVRDNHNRRVDSVAKKSQLRALFEKSLMLLVLENLTPAKRLLNFILNQSWNGAFGWLRQAARKATAVVAAWITKAKWALVKVIVWSRTTYAPATRWQLENAQTNFHSLIPSILSSTILLR